jgi:hypothetical protein
LCAVSVKHDSLFCPVFAGPEAAPRYCRVFQGVKCNPSNQVLELDLTKLEIEGQVSSLALHNITEAIASLASLETLILAGVGILGNISAVFEATSNAFPNLRVLDISSSNPGITGPLPQELALLTILRILDVSGCGVSGTLPVSFVALQQLREFRAVNCTALSGTLPRDWG